MPVTSSCKQMLVEWGRRTKAIMYVAYASASRMHTEQSATPVSLAAISYDEKLGLAGPNYTPV